jgi:hypothetical protein
MPKRKNFLPRIASIALIITGITAISFSLMISSAILSLIGLGLTFWGVLLLYIQKEEYVQTVFIDKTTLPSLLNLHKMIKELGFKGQAIYLPPKFLKDPETNKLFIAKNEKTKLSALNLDEISETMFTKKPEGIIITPPGADLIKQFEKSLNTYFLKVDLEYMVRNLPKLFVNDLEIAEDFNIDFTGNHVTARLKNSIFTKLHTETERLPETSSSIGCPICSAIACAITRATGKPTTITSHKTSLDGKTITTEYILI